MKAIIYDQNNVTYPLVYGDAVQPLPKDFEVLVSVKTVSMNAADYRSMKLKAIPKRKIFGSDIAGIVEGIGNKVTKFKIGDEVCGDISGSGLGGFAEYTVASENALVLKPKNVSFETASATPMSAVTALQGLRNKGNIQVGQRVLIYGAGGGVGTFAVQLAKYFGAHVSAVCGSNNVESVKSLGADQVINYHETDITKSNARYDLVLVVNGNNPLPDYKRLLAKMGRCVMVGGSLSQVIKTMLFGSVLSLGSKKMCLLNAKPNAEDLEFIMKLVEEGKVKPVIDRRYPLSETPEAMRYLSKGHVRGKVIIEIDNKTD